MKKEKLWTPSFLAIGGGSFLLFFAFYLLLPILPLYLIERFEANESTVGMVLSLYTVTALFMRPFAGFMVDTFPRKPLMLVCYAVFTCIFGGYLLAASILAFAVIRALHGFSFGIVSVANSTVAIDVMPSSRRGEGIGYFGVSSNLAMAVGPTVSLYLLEASHNYDTIFWVSLLSCCVGFVLVTTVRMPVKERQPKPVAEHISFDRFFLVKGTSGAISVSMLSFSYGMLSTYLAIYGKDEVGMESETGVFFMLMAFGLILSRLISGQLLNKGYITRLIQLGIIILFVGYTLFIFVKMPVTYFMSAAILGMGYGFVCPSFQTYFINLAEHNQRGTANSTYLTSWDLGVGLGVLIGGGIADMSDYTTAYICSLVILFIGYFFFRYISAPYFARHKLR